MGGEERWEETRPIASYETDVHSELKLSALWRICQEISGRHLTAHGLSYERMKADGKVFLFLCNAAEIARMPRHREPVRFSTWPCGRRAAQFYRRYRLENAETGERLVDVNQSSVLVDPAAHKVLRPKEFLDYGYPIGEAEGEPLRRLELPEGMEPVGERTVRYSDLDYNGHLNNAVYGDIVCDCFPGGMFGRRIRAAQMHYESEARYGETLRVSAKQTTDGVYFCGEHPRGLCFTALLRTEGRPGEAAPSKPE